MTNSILVVESRPAAPDLVDDYNLWQDETHIPEMLRVEGFASARRFEVGEGSYVTVYELDAEPDVAKANLRRAVENGEISKPVAMELDPPPVMRYLSPV